MRTSSSLSIGLLLMYSSKSPLEANCRIRKTLVEVSTTSYSLIWINNKNKVLNLFIRQIDFVTTRLIYSGTFSSICEPPFKNARLLSGSVLCKTFYSKMSFQKRMQIKVAKPDSEERKRFRYFKKREKMLRRKRQL